MTFLGKELSFSGTVYDCLIVGSGAAGYNAAVHLYDKGVRNFAVLTESRLAGTSRNTGSDKQTYYKIACSGGEKDSPLAMAETLFGGGSMDGDLALCEASQSLEEFFHLVSLGVDFPRNRYGEYPGYKTDHDPLQRASSIGPYTSKKMTEQLERAAAARNIPVIDNSRALKILTRDGRSTGLLCMEKNGGSFRVYFSRNIIFAAGGPPGLYSSTVYPPSQFGSSGILARAGAVFSNITEWQYGIGSVKFRWNLSGSYQQVIPRYLSLDENGGEEEFLDRYFPSAESRDRAVFLKGYQWPFDPAKLGAGASSVVDLAVYIEKHRKGRRVFLDYTRNPRGFAPDKTDSTARDYLVKSNALAPSPLERLLRLNPAALELYRSHGIDLNGEYLEIDVLPQHHNGGAEVNIWWESSVKHLFAIGECAGTHGVHRPGGSALNAGQVGGLRAASFIAGRYLKEEDNLGGIDALKAGAAETLAAFEAECSHSFSPEGKSAREMLRRLEELNTESAAFIRCRDTLLESREELEALAREKIVPGDDLAVFFRFKEMLLLSRLLRGGILAYIEDGGKSRGSYLIAASGKDIEAALEGVETDTLHRDKIINTVYDSGTDSIRSTLRPVRPIPEPDTWFENVWREYREGTIYNS